MTQEQFQVFNRALSIASTAVKNMAVEHPGWLAEVEQACDLLVQMRIAASLAEMNERINGQPYRPYSPIRCSCGQPACDCSHDPSEECMICSTCGRCDETCDEASGEMCQSCRTRLCDRLDEAIKNSTK